MLTEPLFYAAALPAVALYGLSKGGFSGVGLLSIPLMALVMSPVTAAAIVLPVLLVQDAYTVYAFRNTYDRTTLGYILPGGALGIVLGTLTAAYVTDSVIRVAVGLLAVGFSLNAWFGAKAAAGAVRPHNRLAATALGTAAGYSSFVIHAGGPPYNVYALPRVSSRDLFVGTSAIFFALANLVKVPLFLSLGQLSIENLYLSAVLMPFAIAANMAGIWLVKRVPTALFYRIIYGLTFLIGLKLLADGLAILPLAKA